jgi:UDP-N-acetylglucosamine--N-acetylmuramyl-(pentapeptide) pyrophosphoryl-undecaprenol N-acetylglucosamine transferase
MKVVIAGGGTGGHIYPAVAVVEYLRACGDVTDVVFVGTRRGLEAGILPRLGYRTRWIVSRPLPSGRGLGLAFSLACAFVGFLQSVTILLTERPHVVIGTGGYASGPFVVAASLVGTPTVLIEPNSVPGRTTMLLARFVDEIALGFKESVQHFARGTNLRVTGIPVRSNLVTCSRDAGIETFGLDPGRKTVFVFGGSRGAASINRAFVEAARRLEPRDDLQFIVQTGDTDHQAVSQHVRDLSLLAKVYPYIENMEAAYAAADLVVCRAGASTIAELTACGLPSILIPYPHATGHHQEANARLLEQRGAASVILDHELTGEVLAERIMSMVGDPQRLDDMAGRSRDLGNTDAAREIAARLKELAARKGRLSKLVTILGDLCSAR